MTKDKSNELSDCHQAPVVICEGAMWDVDPESIKDGSTFYYGCTECHEMCGLYVESKEDTISVTFYESEIEFSTSEFESKEAAVTAPHNSLPFATDSSIAGEELSEILANFSQAVVDAYKEHGTDVKWKEYIDAYESAKNDAIAAINRLYVPRAVVREAVDNVGDKPMPHTGKSGKYVKSPQSFQDGFEEARAEIREKLGV